MQRQNGFHIRRLPPLFLASPFAWSKCALGIASFHFSLLGGVSRHKNTAPWCFCLLTSRRGARVPPLSLLYLCHSEEPRSGLRSLPQRGKGDRLRWMRRPARKYEEGKKSLFAFFPPPPPLRPLCNTPHPSRFARHLPPLGKATSPWLFGTSDVRSISGESKRKIRGGDTRIGTFPD